VVPGLNSAVVDRKGNVFAFAGKNNGNQCFIVKFDKNLDFQKRFGREGKGPAEFSTKFSTTENRLSISSDGDLYVCDYNPRKLVVFDNDGNHKKDIPIDRDYAETLGRINYIKVVGCDRFVGKQWQRNLPSEGLLFTLNPLQIKVRYTFSEKKIFYLNGISFTERFCGDNCIIDTDSRLVALGDSRRYKFHVYDGNGDLILEVFDKKRTMGSFSSGELKYIIERCLTPNSGRPALANDTFSQLKANRPEYNRLIKEIQRSKNVISDIKISGDRIYVFPVSEDISIENKFPVEIYDLKGRMVKTGYFGKMPDRIWMDYVFFYDRDEEDNPLILKYKII
jgi:hypothetical protein